MKTKDIKDLRTKKIEELKKMVDSKKSESTLLFSKVRAGKEKNTSKLKALKKEIAQIMSVVSEMEILEKLTKKG